MSANVLGLVLKTGLHTKISRFLHTYEVDDSKYRIVPMEGLRGVAVLLVFFVHFHALFGEALPHESWSHSVFEFLGTVGNAGVDLFFVMSGFLIYGALIRRQSPYWTFIRRRIERIYPTFLAVFGVYLLLSIFFPAQNKIHGTPLRAALYVLENLLLFPGILRIQPVITVAWSLSYEFFFYLVLPLTIFLFGLRSWKPRSRTIAVCLAWTIFAGVSLAAAMENRTRMISFVSGMLLYEVTASARFRGKLSRAGELVVLALVTAGFVFFYEVHRPRSHSSVNPFAPIMVLSACFFLLALYAFEFEGGFARVFSWSPLRFLGNMSYSYYLIHGLTLQAVALLLLRARILPGTVGITWALLPAAFAATWIVSTALFLTVERRYSLSHRSATAKVMANFVESRKSSDGDVQKERLQAKDGKTAEMLSE